MNLDSFSSESAESILLTVAAILIILIIRWTIVRLIVRRSRIKDYEITRKVYLVKVVDILMTFSVFGAITFIWSVDFKELTTFFTAFFTVVGVGLFAQWSILSNITASFILFFNFPFKVGSKIKIIDGENSITGVITDITLFSIRILTIDKENIAYPNSLAIQKPIHIIDEN